MARNALAALAAPAGGKSPAPGDAPKSGTAAPVAGKAPAAADRAALVAEMRAAARDEIETARQLFALAREDSRIGYEASNHYYYLPVDLVEKVLNCRQILEGPLAPEAGP